MDLAKLKGAYRGAWVHNQLLFKRAAEALGALGDAGVPTLVLKGIALSIAHYRDDGVRPMEDIDVLVPRRDFERAITVLRGAGWAAGREYIPTGGLRAVHAEHLQHREGGVCLDLHRYALAQAASDDEFWSAAVEIELLNAPTRILCPADQLLHVAVHGARWNRVPPVRWLADAVVIERSAGADLDWDRLVAEATRRGVTATLAAALECLVGAVEFPLPDGVLERLARRTEGPAGAMGLQSRAAADGRRKLAAGDPRRLRPTVAHRPLGSPDRVSAGALRGANARTARSAPRPQDRAGGARAEREADRAEPGRCVHRVRSARGQPALGPAGALRVVRDRLPVVLVALAGSRFGALR